MPPYEIREYLEERCYTCKREYEQDRPSDRRRVVEEHYEEREPEAGAPRARYKRVQSMEEGVRRRMRESVANELGHNVVAHKTHETEDSERHKHYIYKWDRSIHEAVLKKPAHAGQHYIEEEDAKDDVPERGFHACHTIECTV